MDKTIRPQLGKDRTQSVSMPPQKKLRIKKTYNPPAVEEQEEQEVYRPPMTQIMEEIPPALYLVTGSSSKSFPIDPKEYIITIGKDKKADITIDDDQLSPTHLMIVKVNKECLFMDRGKRDLVKFDGIHTRQACKPIDSRLVIRMGKHWLIYDAAELSTQTVSINKKLIIVDSLSQETSPGEVRFKYKNKNFQSSSESFLIGTHSSCDIKLYSENAADFTALVSWTAEGVFFEKMGACRDAILINGRRIAKATRINDGDGISIGQEKIYIEFQGDIEQRCQSLFGKVEAQPALALTVLAGHDAETIPLTANTTSMIGRISTADIQIDSPSISRVHAKLTIHDKSALIADNASFNKVKVNREVVEKATILPGDIIELGECALLFHYTLMRY